MATQASSTVLPPARDEQATRIEEALVRAARGLTARLDVDGVCQAVLDAVGDVFGARSCWILLHHAATKQLRTACARGQGSEAFQNLAISPETGILGLAFRNQQVVFVPNVKDDDRWFDPPRVHAAALQSVFAIPLLYRNEALGVVGLDSPWFTADAPPADAHIARLEALVVHFTNTLTFFCLY